MDGTMIELHRMEKDSFADEIEEQLKWMVLAYQTIRHPGSSKTALQDSGHPTHENSVSASSRDTAQNLPFIRESGKVIYGKDEIFMWLEELDRELKQQRSVSGDSCYIDPQSGEVC